VFLGVGGSAMKMWDAVAAPWKQALLQCGRSYFSDMDSLILQDQQRAAFFHNMFVFVLDFEVCIKR
jgi:hypothetical protein